MPTIITIITLQILVSEKKNKILAVILYNEDNSALYNTYLVCV